MYIHSGWDRALVHERVAQFRDQTRRYLAGELEEEHYRPLRLMNGLYIQRHAPMLRVAIPYGVLASDQLRALAHIAKDYDRGFGHFTTRQNIQFNWIPLEQIPDVLGELAEVGLHAIQTSGNCIRNVTCDPLAGLTSDEVADPRPWCEVIRQWSTFHPEFAYLPRKFKIAVTGSPADRAITQVHDIGLQLRRGDDGGLGFRLLVGGGLGREPHIGKVLEDFFPAQQLLTRLSAVLRVYNLAGRRDKLYKSRIKVLVKSLGLDDFRDRVTAEWQNQQQEYPVDALAVHAEVRGRFRDPDLVPLPAEEGDAEPAQRQWRMVNTWRHRVAGHRAVALPLKGLSRHPGDLDASAMAAVAELADTYSSGEIRTTQRQNLVLPHVAERDLPALWERLRVLDLAEPIIGTAADPIACPGLDYCSLANVETLEPARQLRQALGELERAHGLGPLAINISGCMNACGHHHVGTIGLLGVDKRGAPHFQITLGGDAGARTRLGQVLGPAIPADAIIEAIERLLAVYRHHRRPDERFGATLERIGLQPFKEGVYDHHHA
ncbi:MAG: nitrite/sulfite reductase [Halomonas sp.]